MDDSDGLDEVTIPHFLKFETAFPFLCSWDGFTGTLLALYVLSWLLLACIFGCFQLRLEILP